MASDNKGTVLTGTVGRKQSSLGSSGTGRGEGSASVPDGAGGCDGHTQVAEAGDRDTGGPTHVRVALCLRVLPTLSRAPPPRCSVSREGAGRGGPQHFQGLCRSSSRSCGGEASPPSRSPGPHPEPAAPQAQAGWPRMGSWGRAPKSSSPGCRREDSKPGMGGAESDRQEGHRPGGHHGAPQRHLQTSEKPALCGQQPSGLLTVRGGSRSARRQTRTEDANAARRPWRTPFAEQRLWPCCPSW